MAKKKAAAKKKAPAKVVKQPHGGELHVPPKGVSMNPKGRPPKLLSSIVQELRSQGVERATAGTVSDVYESMLNVDVPTLKKWADDDEQPVAIRIIAKSMLGKRGWEVMQGMLDRAHGKPNRALDPNMVPDKIPDAEKITIELPGGLMLDIQ